MYYTVVEVRGRGFIHTGMIAEEEEGLLERAKEAFPQYENLIVMKMEGGNPDNKEDDTPIPF